MCTYQNNFNFYESKQNLQFVKNIHKTKKLTKSKFKQQAYFLAAFGVVFMFTSTASMIVSQLQKK